MRRRLSTFLIVVAFALASVGCVGSARLRAFDELLTVGKTATLSAKLERGGFLFWGRDVHGAKITFEILHVPESAKSEKPVYVELCEAHTNRDGIASADMKGFFKGVHLIRAIYPAGSAVQAFSRVFVVDPKTPILVCDIDHTIADISTLGFLTTEPHDVEPLPGAVEALMRLGEKYAIVYLTARDDSFHDTTMEWLRIKGFPEGPVFFSDLSKTAFAGSARRFKSSRIAQWRDAGLNLQVGVGDRPQDAQAYLSNGMKAFILTDEPQKLPYDATAVESWTEMANTILKQPASLRNP